MNNDNYKKWFIGLAGGFVVIAGVLTSSFYVSYEKVKGELAQTSGELLNAQSQVEDLTKELEESSNAVEETREGYVTVMLQDGEKEDLPEIPFSVDLEDWNYVLVNEKNPLQQDFEVDLAKTDNGKYVDRRIQKALEMMLADGKKEGLPLMVCSAYRDYQKQDQLMVDVNPAHKPILQSADILKKISALKPGDKVVLHWAHYYMHRNSSSFPERPVISVEPAALSGGKTGK